MSYSMMARVATCSPSSMRTSGSSSRRRSSSSSKTSFSCPNGKSGFTTWKASWRHAVGLFHHCKRHLLSRLYQRRMKKSEVSRRRHGPLLRKRGIPLPTQHNQPMVNRTNRRLRSTFRRCSKASLSSSSATSVVCQDTQKSLQHHTSSIGIEHYMISSTAATEPTEVP